MALSRSIVQPFRANMILIGAGWRSFFAPWDYIAAQNTSTGGPNILDLEKQGPFNLASVGSGFASTLPAGWSDCGWIKEFKATPQSKIGQVRSGYRGAVRAQYRGQVGLQFDFKFKEAGRLQWKLSTGTQVFNILATNVSSPSTTSPIGSPGQPAVSMTTYSVISGSAQLTVASASGFSVGQYIVADIDYTPGTSGRLGENGTFAFPNAVTDVDYIRKASDFVARVTAIQGNVLSLDQPFVGGGSPAATNGTPPAGSKVQVVDGWTSREGGTFIQEWSGLVISDTIDGAQIALYFPHISISQFAEFPNWAIENIGTTDMTGYDLYATFETLAFDDPIDGETICGYHAFYPNARTQNVW